MLLDFFPPRLGADAGDVIALGQTDRLTQAGQRAADAPWTAGSAGELERLLLPCIRMMQGRWAEALELTVVRLPYLALDRSGLAFGHLIGAAALRGLARPAEAAYWASLAWEQAGSPAAQSLRLPALCLWAELNAELGQIEQAQARIATALRLAHKQPDGAVHAHIAAVRVLQNHDLTRSTYHQTVALGLVRTPRQDALLKQAVTDVPAQLDRRPDVRRNVELHLLSGIGLETCGVRISAARSPRAVLLLAYLQLHGGEPIREVARQLLPPDSVSKSAAQTETDRAARIRQTVNRARALLGDPAAVISQGGCLSLSARYTWDSDLRRMLATGTYDAEQLAPLLHCPWLDDLRFTLACD